MKVSLKPMAVLLFGLVGSVNAAVAAPNSWSEAAANPGILPAPLNTPAPPAVVNDLGGGVFHFTTMAEFHDTGVVLVTDDLFSSLVGPNAICTDFFPVSSATNDLCFATGDLLPGYQLNGLPVADDYAFLTTGFLVAPTNVIGPNTFVDDSEFTFSPAVDAFGAYLYALAGPVDATIDLYDAGGVLLASTLVSGSAAGQYFGFTSSNRQIARVVVTDAAGGGELFGTLEFGNFAPVAPIPTMSSWSLYLLIGLLGLVGWRVVRKSAVAV